MSTAQALLQRVFPSRGAAKQSSADTPDEGAEANTTPVHQNGLSSTEEKENEMSDPVDTPEAKAPAVDAKAEQDAGRQAERDRFKAIMATDTGKANPEAAAELMGLMPEASAEDVVAKMKALGVTGQPKAETETDGAEDGQQAAMQTLADSDTPVAPNNSADANGQSIDWNTTYAEASKGAF